ncbi:S41 family peptidase [Novosphingobium decolorationis]|uniref:S41 family peptidase n=1 Tax=Novosphingobium decolorationis TaxID=2698673 RepID=A0ABX8E361_9SPHN|nr:S41 family peptidase [Novosphingobium decolorationis]QVM83592.1 S41 family peptidase [Novosphingobium decolorationis]
MIRVPAAALLAATCLSAPLSAQAQAAQSKAPRPWEAAGPVQSIARSDGSTDPAVRGIWRSRGYGWLLEIDEAGVIRHQEGTTCYRPPLERGAQSEMDSARYRYFRALPGGQAAIFQLLEGDTNVVFDRLPALPEACSAPTDRTPGAVAAAFLDHFERHYAFFDRRPPGFAARRAALRAKMHPGMDEAQLWDALAAFMEGLSDSHTKLLGEVDGERRRVQDGQGQTLPRIRAREGGEPAWLGALIAQTTAKLGKSARTVGGGRIVWGVIDGRVGYLQVFVMGGFTERSDFATPQWAEAEMAAFQDALDQAMADFAGLDGVIVDLSNNRGGWDQIAKALPARFLDTAQTGFTTRARGSGLAPFPHAITPATGARFAGPVYVITSDVTVSGGELATLAFRQNPRVTQVGTRTRGAFSTPLAKPLPNGWLLELANETFAAPDGTVYEETGLAPEIELEIYPEEAPVAGHWNAVETVAAMVAHVRERTAQLR